MNWKWKKEPASVQTLLGVRGFTQTGLSTDGHGELVLLCVSPTNISVLSEDALAEKVNRLTMLLSAQPDLEMVCTDGQESYAANKQYLDSRYAEEENPKIRELLSRDREFLDEMQFRKSTAREFLFLVRLDKGADEQSFSRLNRLEKCISDQGFSCRRADRDAVKRILARYFGIRTPDTVIGDHDGDAAAEKWIIPD